MRTLRDIGAVKLLSSEQAVARHAADALLFCADIAHDRAARASYAAFGAVHEQLVASGRWTSESAGALADDVWACGPGLDVPVVRAA